MVNVKYEDREWRMEDGGAGKMRDASCGMALGCVLRVAWGILGASGCARLWSLSLGLFGKISEFGVLNVQGLRVWGCRIRPVFWRANRFRSVSLGLKFMKVQNHGFKVPSWGWENPRGGGQGEP